MELESLLKSLKNLQALVIAQDHANCDSLPLRYGLHFEQDTLIDLSQTRYLYSDYQYPDRHHIEALFQGVGDQLVTGHFVIGNKRGFTEPVVITVWRGDVSTEMRLSEVMIALRKRGFITPETLLGLHPLYVEGKVSTSADLIEQLTRQLSAEKLSAMSTEVMAANEKADQALAALEAANKRADIAKNVALEASYIVDELESQNGQLSGRVDELEAELDRYKAEQAAAARERSEATLSSPDTLVDVREKQMYRGSSCTILLFADGTTRHMKTSTFDPSGEVTSRAISLKGRRVRTSCWDPIGQPGKWSSQGYFRNVYAYE
jgi:hypothetical protein